MPSQIRRPIRFILVIALLGTVFGFPAALPASATHVTCDWGNPDDPAPFDGEEYNVAAYKSNSQHRGVASWGPGMWVGNGDHNDTPCERISSLFVYQDFQNYVEIGWYEIPVTVTSCVNDPPANTTPRLLLLYKKAGQAHCFAEQDTLSTDFHGFRIDNANADETFAYYLDGDLVTVTPSMGFSVGYTVINTERTSGGIAWGEFKTVFHQTGAGWVSWSNAVGFCDNDTAYKRTSLAADWWKIETGTSTYVACPPF